MAYSRDPLPIQTGSVSRFDTQQKRLKNSNATSNQLIYKFCPLKAGAVGKVAGPRHVWILSSSSVLQNSVLQVSNRKQMTREVEALKGKKGGRENEAINS